MGGRDCVWTILPRANFFSCPLRAGIIPFIAKSLEEMLRMNASPCPSFFKAAPMGRREFLRAGSLGLFGLSLPQLLHGQAVSAQSHPRPRAKACILLFMWGGPAQQDTWDMKPDAPVEYRGEFGPIATRVPGVRICEHLPRLARQTDKLAI